MTNAEALARIREHVAVAREVEQETSGNVAAQVGVLRFLLTTCERTLAEVDGGEDR